MSCCPGLTLPCDGAPLTIDRRFDEVYQLAADMGGAGYIFTGEHDAAIMHNSATLNLNILETCKNRNIRRIFYSSSACMYPKYNQTDPSAPVGIAPAFVEICLAGLAG